MAPVVIPDVTDHEGIDEWVMNLFDMNGDHFNPEVENYHGTYSACVLNAADFISRHKGMVIRVALERIM